MKNIENMSHEEVVAHFQKIKSLSIPFYPNRYAGLRMKLNSLVKKNVLKAEKHDGYTIYSLPIV